MNNKNTGMIVTALVALLCGCCSLFACIMGVGAITGNGTYDLGGTSQAMPPTVGYLFLCLSIIFIIVPVVVGFFMLRKKPEAIPENIQVPPAS